MPIPALPNWKITLLTETTSELLARSNHRLQVNSLCMSKCSCHIQSLPLSQNVNVWWRNKGKWVRSSKWVRITILCSSECNSVSCTLDNKKKNWTCDLRLTLLVFVPLASCCWNDGCFPFPQLWSNQKMKTPHLLTGTAPLPAAGTGPPGVVPLPAVRACSKEQNHQLILLWPVP
jgi:hypothetical protein